MPVNLNDIAILNIYSVDYRCIINEVSKSEAVNLLKASDLSQKSGSVYIFFSISCINAEC